MKKYRFESELSPEELIERIRITAKPAQGEWRYIENTLFYTTEDKNEFTLLKTGSCGAGKGQTPFHGKILNDDGKTVIEGSFYPAKKAQLLILIFSLLPLIFAVGSIVLLLIYLPLWLLWIGLIRLMFWKLPTLVWKNQVSAVLEYIENRLCKREIA